MLADNLKVILASTFSYYLKAQGFHWNVESRNFSQDHEFFGEIYTDAYSAIDPLAEYIRTLSEYAPASLSRYTELTKIEDQTKIPKSELMIKELIVDTQTLIDLITEAFDIATEDKQQGIANFLADRLTSHGKYLWQLKATIE